MLCEICKTNPSSFEVTIVDSKDNYRYKKSIRCSHCTDVARKSHKKIEIKRISS